MTTVAGAVHFCLDQAVWMITIVSSGPDSFVVFWNCDYAELGYLFRMYPLEHGYRCPILISSYLAVPPGLAG